MAILVLKNCAEKNYIKEYVKKRNNNNLKNV